MEQWHAIKFSTCKEQVCPKSKPVRRLANCKPSSEMATAHPANRPQLRRFRQSREFQVCSLTAAEAPFSHNHLWHHISLMPKLAA